MAIEAVPSCIFPVGAPDTVRFVRLVGPVRIVQGDIDLSGWITAVSTVVLVGATIYSYWEHKSSMNAWRGRGRPDGARRSGSFS